MHWTGSARHWGLSIDSNQSLPVPTGACIAPSGELIMRTYYFEMQDGVPIRDLTGLEFRTNTGAIEHSKELAQRFSHDHRLKDPIRSIIVLDGSGTEIHREPAKQDIPRTGVAITFEKIG